MRHKWENTTIRRKFTTYISVKKVRYDEAHLEGQIGLSVPTTIQLTLLPLQHLIRIISYDMYWKVLLMARNNTRRLVSAAAIFIIALYSSSIDRAPLHRTTWEILQSVLIIIYSSHITVNISRKVIKQKANATNYFFRQWRQNLHGTFLETRKWIS